MQVSTFFSFFFLSEISWIFFVCDYETFFLCVFCTSFDQPDHRDSTQIDVNLKAKTIYTVVPEHFLAPFD